MPPTLTFAEIEAYFIAEIHTPEAQALLARLLDQAKAAIESGTTNPFLIQVEDSAFALVKGYLLQPQAA